MYDLYVKKKVCDDNLVNVIAKLFCVETNEVLLVDDINKIVEYGICPVTVERRFNSNGYKIFLSIYTRKKSYEEPLVAKKISRLLSLEVLYAAQSENLYEWVRVSPSGNCKNVLLCDDPMDERGEAVISNFTP
jgi:hypothetical protein